MAAEENPEDRSAIKDTTKAIGGDAAQLLKDSTALASAADDHAIKVHMATVATHMADAIEAAAAKAEETAVSHCSNAKSL